MADSKIAADSDLFNTLGYKQTPSRPKSMSALPSTPDIRALIQRPRFRGENILKICGVDKSPRTLRRTFSPKLLPDKPLQREPRRENTIMSGLLGSAGFKTSRLVWVT